MFRSLFDVLKDKAIIDSLPENSKEKDYSYFNVNIQADFDSSMIMGAKLIKDPNFKDYYCVYTYKDKWVSRGIPAYAVLDRVEHEVRERDGFKFDHFTIRIFDITPGWIVTIDYELPISFNRNNICTLDWRELTKFIRRIPYMGFYTTPIPSMKTCDVYHNYYFLFNKIPNLVELSVIKCNEGRNDGDTVFHSMVRLDKKFYGCCEPNLVDDVINGLINDSIVNPLFSYFHGSEDSFKNMIDCSYGEDSGKDHTLRLRVSKN